MIYIFQSTVSLLKYLVVLLLFNVQTATIQLCSELESVDITNGTMDEAGSVVYNGVRYKPSQYFRDEDVLRGCICLVHRCIYVCEAENITRVELTELYANVSDATGTNMSLSNLATHDRFHLILKEPQCAGAWLLLEQSDVIMTLNGELKLNEYLFNYHQFCMLPINDMGEFLAAYCEPQISDITNKMYAFAFLVSLPFLVITFVVYAVLPELQNVPGLSVMSYVATLAVSYLLLALGRLDICDYQSFMCRVSGYALYFTLMASLFWLSIMSFDIYWAFDGFRGRTSERRKFLYYCLYAWGVPLIFLSLILLFDHTELINYNLRPNIGEEACFLKPDRKVQFIYFYLPLLLLICGCIYFLAITAKRIHQTDQTSVVILRGDSRGHTKYEKDRKRFRLYALLFTILGLFWSLEIISWLQTGAKTLSPSWVEYILEVCNSIIGIVIFFLFVWKQRVKKLLLKRFCRTLVNSEISETNDSSNVHSIELTNR